jgi:hypothetical protein
MWNRRVSHEPSEVGKPDYSPSLWTEIHKQNRVQELEKNRARAPLVRDVPTSWLCVVMWMFMVSYFSTIQSILHL